MLLGFFLSLVGYGQTFLIADGPGLDNNRYKEVEGSPYFFEEFIELNITDSKGTVMQLEAGNFNAHTGNIEIQKNGKLIEVDERYVLEAVFKKEREIFRFIPGKRVGRPVAFVRLYFEGRNYLLYDLIFARITEKTFQNVGKTIHIERFQNREELYLCRLNKCDEIKLKKKDIENLIGSEEFESYIKKHNIKFKEIDELISLLAYLDIQ